MCTRVLTYFIEIERVFAGHGTVEPRFQEARPSVVERMRSALVVLAHSTDPRVHRLKHKWARTFRTILRYFSALWWDRLALLQPAYRAIILGYFARLGRGPRVKDLARENLRMDWKKIGCGFVRWNNVLRFCWLFKSDDISMGYFLFVCEIIYRMFKILFRNFYQCFNSRKFWKQ